MSKILREEYNGLLARVQAMKEEATKKGIDLDADSAESETKVLVSAGNALELLLGKLRTGEGDKLFDAGPVFKDFECGPGLVTIVGAGPGCGKTTLIQQYVFSAIELNDDLTAIIANAEMSFEVLLKRELARRSGVHSKALRFANLTPSQLGRVEDAAQKLAPLLERIQVMQGPFSLMRLQEATRQAKPGIVVVDYLQMFGGDSEDARQAVNQTAVAMRHMAAVGWAVIALSATARTKSKGGSSHDSSLLSLASYKESGEVEFKADACYLIRDLGPVDEGNPKVKSVKLECVKNRHGDMTPLELVFNMPLLRFERIEQEPQRHSEFDEYQTSNGVYEFADDPFADDPLATGVDF